MNPLLFCNIGWMREYRGQTRIDKIIGGGRYVQVAERGNEVCNFSPIRGRVYGWVQPVREQIRLERLGADRKASSLTGVDVVLTARRPQAETYVVGWYANATVYRKSQRIPNPDRLHLSNSVREFRYETGQEDSKLLSDDERVLEVPRRVKGGLGQSNVWYADNAPTAFESQARKLIAGRSSEKSHSPRSRRPSHFQNALVEKAAMDLAWQHFERLGYVLSDVSKQNLGWDLEARSGSQTLQIEVKGLSNTVPAIELTPNEYRVFKKCSLSYRLFIVTNAQSEPEELVCRFNPASDGWIAEGKERAKRIRIKERVAASIAVV